MKIKIQRAFSGKVQLKQFEPIESFCAMEAELDAKTGLEEAKIGQISASLDGFCRTEVEKTLNAEIAKHNLTASKGKSPHEIREISLDSAELDSGASVEEE